MKRIRGTGNRELGTGNWVRVLCALLLFTLTFCLHLSAAVPLRWTVETSRATPATFEAYQGETLELEAALQSYGKPLEAPSDYSLFWQTNGMGSTYWESPCQPTPTPTNVLFATWSPTNDVGAKVYNCFIGKPGTIYHAAFQLRLRPSPGALPNELPLPQKVIDFAKVTVLNPPWSGGGGVDTNAVLGLIAPATNRLYKTLIDAKDGAARPLPKYLWLYNADDSYPEAAEEYYRQRLDFGGCSAVRSGGFVSRNFDYPFDDRAEFVVKMSAGPNRFASVGVAQVGTNLTEQIVTSGKPSRWYKALPGATVDGINENGVVAEINVVDGDPQWAGGASPALHPLAAVRWALDHATNAEHAATYLAAHIAFPQGWTQNFHYMIADETATYIVENGAAHAVPSEPSPTGALPALTNFRLYGDPKDTTGEGQERYIALTNGANITSQWWTLTYTADGYRASDLPGITGAALTQLFDYWASKPREAHRGESFAAVPSSQFPVPSFWWQTIHTSVYDLTNRVLRVAVQERPDWYTFQVQSAGGTDEAKVREIAAEVVAPVASSVTDLQSATTALQSQVSGLQSSKVPWVEDSYGNLTAVTIGTRASGSVVGQYSLAQGNNVKAEGYYAHAEGSETHAKDWATHAEGIATHAEGEGTHAEGMSTHAEGIATHAEGMSTHAGSGDGAHAEGVYSDATNNYAFAWQGVDEYDDDGNPIRYGSHGDGTFNLNPVGGLAGLWIGERNMEQIFGGYVPNDADYANVRAKALNSAQYHEYGYPFLGRQDLMVKDAMVVGTTNYAQRAQHTEYCDGTIQNEARGCYLYLPHNKSGDIAVEDPFEIVALIDIASTNATARTSLSAKVMSVIDAAVEAKITTALAAHRIRTYDDVRHCWWVCDVVNGVPTWTVEE